MEEAQEDNDLFFVCKKTVVFPFVRIITWLK